MLLAAGRGERLRPLTDSVPKPLIEVGGKPLIEYHIERLRDAGVTHIVVNVAWLKNELIEFLGDGAKWGVSIAISEEPPGALDTGGGVRNTLKLLGDAPFWVVNSDIYSDYPFAHRALAANDLAHLVLAYGSSSDFCCRRGRIANTGVDMNTFAGIGLYRPEFFARGPTGAFSSVPFLRRAADAGRLAGEVYTGVWDDAGTPGRLEAIRRLSNGF
jgi:MurNAc alpha-1-phosphate uridylyltransferase